MVLWEMTLATAYFLGLKRTYRLALRIQKRLIGPKHPKIRQFVHRRVRSAFDVAVRIHKNIQQRDIEVGRSLGNRILRWLDRMKPAAEIRGSPKMTDNNNIVKNVANPAHQTQRVNTKASESESKGKMLFSSLSMRPKSVQSIAMMMMPMRPTSINTRYRHFSNFAPAAASALSYRVGRSDGSVFRKDIAMLMMQKN